jgi:hypothetical protein
MKRVATLIDAEKVAVRLGVPACGQCGRPSVTLYVRATTHYDHVANGKRKHVACTSWYRIDGGPSLRNTYCDGCVFASGLSPEIRETTLDEPANKP